MLLSYLSNSILYCQAYKHGVMYPQYQLLVYGWYSDGWWRETDPQRDLGCSQEEMNTALQHALAPIQAEFYTNKSLPTEGGWVCVISYHKNKVAFNRQ